MDEFFFGIVGSEIDSLPANINLYVSTTTLYKGLIRIFFNIRQHIDKLISFCFLTLLIIYV